MTYFMDRTSTLAHIVAVQTTQFSAVANDLLRDGWELLSVSHNAGGCPWFVLGLPRVLAPAGQAS